MDKRQQQKGKIGERGAASALVGQVPAQPAALGRPGRSSATLVSFPAAPAPRSQSSARSSQLPTSSRPSSRNGRALPSTTASSWLLSASSSLPSTPAHADGANIEEAAVRRLLRPWTALADCMARIDQMHEREHIQLSDVVARVDQQILVVEAEAKAVAVRQQQLVQLIDQLAARRNELAAHMHRVDVQLLLLAHTPIVSSHAVGKPGQASQSAAPAAPKAAESQRAQLQRQKAQLLADFDALRDGEEAHLDVVRRHSQDLARREDQLRALHAALTPLSSSLRATLHAYAAGPSPEPLRWPPLRPKQRLVEPAVQGQTSRDATRPVWIEFVPLGGTRSCPALFAALAALPPLIGLRLRFFRDATTPQLLLASEDTATWNASAEAETSAGTGAAAEGAAASSTSSSSGAAAAAATAAVATAPAQRVLRPRVSPPAPLVPSDALPRLQLVVVFRQSSSRLDWETEVLQSLRAMPGGLSKVVLLCPPSAVVGGGGSDSCPPMLLPSSVESAFADARVLTVASLPSARVAAEVGGAKDLAHIHSNTLAQIGAHVHSWAELCLQAL